MDVPKPTPLRIIAGTILPDEVYMVDDLPNVHITQLPPNLQMSALDYVQIDWRVGPVVDPGVIRVWNCTQPVIITDPSCDHAMKALRGYVGTRSPEIPPLAASTVQPKPPEQLQVTPKSPPRPPPGEALVELASFILSKDAYRRIVAPLIADMRHEHEEAINQGDLRKAHWVVARAYIQALWPFAYGVFTTVVTILKLAK